MAGPSCVEKCVQGGKTEEECKKECEGSKKSMMPKMSKTVMMGVALVVIVGLAWFFRKRLGLGKKKVAAPVTMPQPE